MIWLINDYEDEDEGVLNISAVDAYFRIELCMPIFLGEAGKSFSKNFKTQNRHIP
jgi:hypothetical protein